MRRTVLLVLPALVALGPTSASVAGIGACVASRASTTCSPAAQHCAPTDTVRVTVVVAAI